jgi:GDP-L-fucose synthase
MITGPSSMIGRQVVEIFKENGAIIDEVRHSETNLLSLEQAHNRFLNFRPEYVIHLAGWNGNIEFNRRFGAEIYYRTATIGLNVLKCCLDFQVNKVLSIISSCAYPDLKNEELVESDFVKGPSNESVRCHGHSKRILDDYSQQLFKQHNLKAVTCVLSNSYGPYDYFAVDRTKVVSGLIRKFIDSKEQNKPFVECWGTGEPKRQFIFSEDAAQLIALALYHHTNPLLTLNIGTPVEITIKQLAETVKEVVGYNGEIKWLTQYQDGQMRKMLSLRRMNSMLPAIEFTPLKTGIEKTVKWYLENRNTWTK